MTEGVELATAYVSLTVSARGIEADLRREISKPIEQAAQQASRAASRDIESQLAKARPNFDHIGKSLQSAAAEATAKARATIDKGLANVGANVERNRNQGLAAVGFSAAGVLGLKSLADAAGDYGEVQSKANVILGTEGAAAAEKFAASATKSAGLSKTAALTATASFAGLGKVAGLQGEELSGFSTGLTQLAGDLASFNNSTVEDAIAAIGSGLRGEAEPLQAFNVLLDDATLKQSAMTLGISDGTTTLTNQQKVLAAHAAILAQTTDAQGDFVRTGDSFANQQRTLTAEVENLKVELGQGLLPAAKTTTSALSGMVGIVGELPDSVKTTGSAIAVAVTAGSAIGGVGKLFASGLGSLTNFAKGLKAAEDGTGGFTNGVKRMISPTGAAVAALTVGVGVFEAWYSASSAAEKANQDFADQAVKTGDVQAAAAKSLQDILDNASGETDGYAESWKRAGLIIGEVSDDIAAGANFDKFRDQIDNVNVGLGDVRSVIDQIRASGGPDEYGLTTATEDNLKAVMAAAREAGPAVEETIGAMVERFRDGKFSGDAFADTVNALAEASQGFELTSGDITLYAGQFEELIGRYGTLTTADEKAIAGAQNTKKGMESRLDALQALTDAYPELAAEISPVLKAMREEIKLTPAQRAAAAEKAAAEEILAAAYEAANTAVADYNDQLKIQRSNYDAGTSAASAYQDAIARSTRVDDQLGGAVSLSKANEDFRTSLSKLPKDIDVASIALGKYNEEQNTAVSNLLSASQASTTYLSTLIAQGNYTGARDQATQLRDAYLEQLQTIGITGAAAQEYIEILGLAPEQVETAILLSGMEEAKFKLETYIALLGPEGIPRDIATEVAMKIRDGDIGGAAKQLEDAIAFMQYIADQNEIKISTRLRPEEDKPNRGRPSIPFRAMGGPVAADRPYIVGEIGPELFVPKAAGAIIPNKDLLTAANGGGTRPAPVINQHITNAGYQETLEATVNGLRAAEVMGY